MVSIIELHSSLVEIRGEKSYMYYTHFKETPLNLKFMDFQHFRNLAI